MAAPDPKPHEKKPPDPLRELLDDKSLADEISKVIDGNDCPSTAELESFVRKQMREPQRIEVKSHLTFCGRCQRLVSQLGETPAAGGAAGGARAAGRSRGREWLRAARWRLGRLPGRTLAVVGSAAALGAVVFLVWSHSGSDFPYGGRLALAQRRAPLRVGEPFLFEIEAPHLIHLIEITLDGDGKIASRVLKGPRGGKFGAGDCISVTPRVAGEFDLYLVPCPEKEGPPERLHKDLVHFLKTETTLSRVNQRSGIEMALRVYQVRFIRTTLRIEP